MVLRAYTAADYSEVSRWWAAQQFPVVPQDMLPKTGLIVEGMCAGFLYTTDAKICWVEWIVANPEVGAEVRGQALDALLDGLLAKAKELGFAFAFTSTVHPRLLERYKQHGFFETDRGVIHLIRGLA